MAFEDPGNRYIRDVTTACTGQHHVQALISFMLARFRGEVRMSCDK
jgi:hypothetical protein